MLIIPVVIIVVLSVIVFKNFNGAGIYSGILIYSIGASALFSLGGVGIFKNMEFRG